MVWLGSCEPGTSLNKECMPKKWDPVLSGGPLICDFWKSLWKIWLWNCLSCVNSCERCSRYFVFGPGEVEARSVTGSSLGAVLVLNCPDFWISSSLLAFREWNLAGKIFSGGYPYNINVVIRHFFAVIHRKHDELYSCPQRLDLSAHHESFSQVSAFHSPSPNHQVAVESHSFTALPAPSWSCPSACDINFSQLVPTNHS